MVEIAQKELDNQANEVYKGNASYEWNDGSSAGMVMDTNFGDGSYSVYIRTDEKTNKITHVLVDYVGNMSDQDEE